MRLGRTILASGAATLLGVMTFAAPAAAVGPRIAVSASSLDFGNVVVGASTTMTVQVSNVGDVGQNLTISNASTIGGAVGEFAITGGGCVFPATIAAGSSCGISVSFAPSFGGSRAATLRIVSNDDVNPELDVTLIGIGVKPLISVNPSSLDFGTVLVGATSATMKVRVSNLGDPGQALTISNASVITGDIADFTVTGGGCGFPSTIAPGSSCDISLIFAPSAAGSRASILRVDSNDALNPYLAVTLIGVGDTPRADLVLTMSASLKPTHAKKSLTYTITVHNAGPAAAMDVQVTDVLAPGSRFVSATIAADSCAPPAVGAASVMCSISSLAAGGSTQIQITVLVDTKKTSLVNSATSSAATQDPDLTNNTATVTTQVR
jgi:uncharacterized repeat protein (TIGR01451 family)